MSPVRPVQRRPQADGFGRWQGPATALVIVASILTALVMHATGKPDEFVDALAYLAAGAIYGALGPHWGRR